MYHQKRGRARGEWWTTCKVRRKLFIVETINDEHVCINDIYKPMDISFVDEFINDDEYSENDGFLDEDEELHDSS
ncbi:hypothetical protein CR513_28085, partial [Mucuna pruriens]